VTTTWFTESLCFLHKCNSSLLVSACVI